MVFQVREPELALQRGDVARHLTQARCGDRLVGELPVECGLGGDQPFAERHGLPLHGVEQPRHLGALVVTEAKW